MANPYSTIWFDSVKLDMPPGSVGIMAGTSTSIVHTKGVWPSAAMNGGPGLIDTTWDALTAFLPPTSTAALNSYAFAA